MYRIYRDFIPYIMKEDISPLVQLEITEYAKRPKLEKLPKGTLPTSSVSFREVESAIRKQDLEKTATLMATFYSQKEARSSPGDSCFLEAVSLMILWDTPSPVQPSFSSKSSNALNKIHGQP
jgi:hypothetical protein